MILNSTFLYLTLNNIHNAPLFSRQNSKYYGTMKLSSCYFYNFSQYILYSISSKPKISINSTSFNRGLSQSIFLTSTGRIDGETTDINLYLCKFENIQVPNDSGGAIFSTYSVSLDSCVLIDLSARNGGAVSVCSSLKIKNTNIKNLSAFYYGFAEISPNSPSIIIDQTLVDNVMSKSSSGFRRHDGSETQLSNSNFTSFKTLSMVSLGEFGRTPNVIFSFNYVANFIAYDKNGALSFWQCDKFSCSDTLFLNITVSNDHVGIANGIVVWLDGTLQTGEFVRCAFSNCQTSNKGRGSLLYAEASSSITISDCFFDESQEKAFNTNTKIFLIHDSNRFLVEKIDFKGKLANNVLKIPNENYHRKLNTFPLGQLLYMLSFLSFVIFAIMLDKYA